MHNGSLARWANPENIRWVTTGITDHPRAGCDALEVSGRGVYGAIAIDWATFRYDVVTRVVR